MPVMIVREMFVLTASVPDTAVFAAAVSSWGGEASRDFRTGMTRRDPGVGLVPT